jgi:hypothetical protein
VISLNQIVTSRLATGAMPLGASGQPSEALLLIDEPNSGLAGPVPLFGPNAGLNLCTSAIGCVEYPTQVTGTNGGTYIVATDGVGGTTPGKNVFQGNVLNNMVSFQGVPFLPPVTTGVVRVYRITNVRVNAAGQIGPITATISTNGQSTLALSTPNVTLAYAAKSVTAKVTPSTPGFSVCQAVTNGSVATLSFTELIPNAFKTRIAPVGTFSSYIGTNSAAYYDSNNLGDIPGQLYSSESGFIFPAVNVQAGLADFGTRLKATFTNLPAGATVYVSGTNIITAPNSVPGNPGGFYAPQPAYALLLTAATGEAGPFAAAGTGMVALSGTNPMAVWEVVNTNTSAIENFSFSVSISYAANTPPVVNPTGPVTPPVAGTPSVTLDYAPSSTVPGASATAPIPRFTPGVMAGSGLPNGIIQIAPCQTLLLFPYLVSIPGWDSGIAISNTSKDPVGTATTTGNCTLNFYGTNAPTTPVYLPADGVSLIAPGTSSATLLSTIVTTAGGFSGYAFASCNFQYAHGFAFISDFGLRNWATDYLALVVNNGNQLNARGVGPAGTTIISSGEALGN